MSDLNKVMLIGRLGGDPEVRYTASGAAVATISVATSERWTDKQTGERQEKTEWHRVVFFQKAAEIAGEYLKKGSQVFIEGKLRTRKWQDKEGVDRYTTEVVVDGSMKTSFQMLGSKPEGSAPAAGGNGGGGFRDKPKTAAKAAPEEGGDWADEDIPF